MVEIKIDLICFKCSKSFQIARREFNRQVRQGRLPDRFFCSHTCACNQFHTDGKYDYTKSTKNLTRRSCRDDLSSFRWFVLRAKYREKHKTNKTCGVDAKYLKQLFESQNGKCPFTGLEMHLPNSTRNGWKEQSPLNASLDRIDNDKGYVDGNVRFICLMANFARHTYTDQQVIDFCKAVADNHKT